MKAVRLASMLLLITACRLYAVDVNISQVDYYLNGSAAALNSEYGQVDVHYTPGSSVQWLNIVADPGSTSERWIVQNLPLLPSTDVGAGSFYTTKYFDLGVARGTDVTLLNAGYTVSSSPLSALPSGLSAQNLVVGASQNLVNSGVPSGLTTLSAPANPTLNWTGPGGLSYVWHGGMPNVIQEDSFCGPGAAANSLQWLNSQHHLGLTQSPGDTMSELASNMGNNNDGNWDGEEVAGKLQYIHDHNLGLEVHYVGGHNLPLVGNYSDANGTAVNNGAVSWDWLWSEMQKGQDIELMTSTHWVVVEGVFQIGSVRGLVYRDDPYQNGSATTEEEAAEIANRHVLTYFADGFTDIGNGNEQIIAMVAESIPEPGVTTLFAAFLTVAFLRGRQAKANRKQVLLQRIVGRF
jgi:hypothetical protein